jgi:hypothetical protein
VSVARFRSTRTIVSLETSSAGSGVDLVESEIPSARLTTRNYGLAAGPDMTIGYDWLVQDYLSLNLRDRADILYVTGRGDTNSFFYITHGPEANFALRF